ncbi:MAG: hypothetical protein CL609_07665 [Anaerolineaceae bacterium]|nr:hypothetical protein [Anaerolineaceae bacterium]
MKRLILFLAILLLTLSAGCANNEYWNNNYSDDEYSDEVYADEDESYDYENDEYSEEDYYSDEEYYADDETLFDSVLNSWLYDSPEDCYEDEYFDEEEQLCLLLDENYDEYNEPSILEDLLTDVFSNIPQGGFEPGENSAEEIETSYAVDGDQLIIENNAEISAETLAQHQQLWSYFARLIPAKDRTMVSMFAISSDGPDETMAWVEPINENDLSSWMLVLDPADAAKPEELTFTLIHEYGHLLTLNQNQIIVGAASCSTYEPQEGCSYENAYVNAYYERFWTELLPEILDIETEEDDDRYYDALDAFYQKYEDQFVSDYAATNLEEDMAESWAYFVLNQRPEGDSIAEQKILFFYDYPELVDLRGEIIKRTNSNLRRNSP